uniref:hydroxymethylglutaryl-CoA lyase n=1 Tax=Echinostoma caproni TaxID=27848 RepID=A0A183B897_9TREM
LVPNTQGLMNALEVKPDEVAVFTAASEIFAQKNINCSIDESLRRFTEVLRISKAKGVPVRGYISCVLGCPYEGSVSPDAVARVAELLWNQGCYEISLGDTIGKGTPESMNRLLTVLLSRGGACPREAIAVHCHDTGGNALANIDVALDSHGVRVIDSAIGGLGGCPYAGPGAPGNVATEAVVRYVRDKGYGLPTGLNLEQLITVSFAFDRPVFLVP